jgi:hypothetical protein
VCSQRHSRSHLARGFDKVGSESCPKCHEDGGPKCREDDYEGMRGGHPSEPGTSEEDKCDRTTNEIQWIHRLKIDRGIHDKARMHKYTYKHTKT